jgi:hypothetical protein
MNACTYLHDKALSYRPSGAYSPKCVEGEFYEVELPLNGVLGSSAFSRALLHWALTLRRRAWREEEQAYAIR